MDIEVGNRVLYKIELTGDKVRQPFIFEEGIITEISPNLGYALIGQWRWKPVNCIVDVLPALPEEEVEEEVVPETGFFALFKGWFR